VCKVCTSSAPVVQGVTGSPGTESPGIAPSPFASRDVQAPFSSPPPSAASTASDGRLFDYSLHAGIHATAL